MPENQIHGEFVLTKNEKTEPEKKLEEVSAENDKSKNNARFYSSLCVYPQNVKFENQEENEEIVLLIRRDLITNVPWIFAALVLAFLPLIVSIFSFLFTPFFNISPSTIAIILFFYYLIITGFVLVEFSLWYFTVGLITSLRIIDFDLTGILTKHVSETRLNLIEDVSYVQVGSIRTLFNYGDVHMQTAGTLTNFEFDRAPEPARVVRIIADLLGKIK